jgi:GT2 family glycosyltransferase
LSQAGKNEVLLLVPPEQEADFADSQQHFPVEAFNSGELARIADAGVYKAVTLVCQGWILAPTYRKAIQREMDRGLPNRYLVYTDHDSLSNDGARTDPHFKPDWCPDYFVDQDYVGGVLTADPCLLASLASDIEEPAMLPWAMLSAVAIGYCRGSVHHIPFVLSHASAGYRVVGPEHRRKWLQTLLGDKAIAKTSPNGLGCRVEYLIPSPSPLVSIIVPTRDRVDLLERCIATIRELTAYPNYQIIVVDNGSTEQETRDFLQKIDAFSDVQVIGYDYPFNFSAINNYGAAKCEGELLCFLNNDIEVIEPNWLDEMVSRILQSGIGCVGAKLLYPEGGVQHGGVIVGFGGVAAHAFVGEAADAVGYGNRLVSAQNYSAVTAACMLTKREVFDEVGGFNDRSLPVAFNDIDYCLRVVESGRRIIWTPYAQLVHHESASRVPETERLSEFAEEIRFMRTRWGHVIEQDPGYNPHLALTEKPFSISDRWLRSKAATDAFRDEANDDTLYGYESNLDRIRAVITNTGVQQSPESLSYGLSIVILNLNKPELIGPLLDALATAKEWLLKQENIPLQIIIGDTGSTDDEVWRIYERHKGDIEIEKDMAYHFSKCNNALYSARVRHEFVLFLNNDIIFSDPATQLMTLLNIAKSRPDLGALGTRLMYPDGRLQHGGVEIFNDGDLKGLCYHPNHGAKISAAIGKQGALKQFPAVTGACLLMNSELFAKCGGFDEGYHAEAQDADLCLKATRLGKPSAVVEIGEVVHLENATRPKGDADTHDRAKFVRRWSRFAETCLA